MISQEQINFDFHNARPQILEDSKDELRLKIGDFAGPLDLLLFLIKQEKANIFDIPIAKITDEYLRYIRLMEQLDIAVASEFLAMAAILIDIKSKMLLPKTPSENKAEESQEDPRLPLVEQLIEYEKIKTAAQMLWEKAIVEQSIYRRGKKQIDEEDLVNASIFDLFKTFHKLVERQNSVPKIQVRGEEISLDKVIKKLKQRLAQTGFLSLYEIAQKINSKIEFIVNFLAILEIARTENVILTQKKPFEDVIVKLLYEN